MNVRHTGLRLAMAFGILIAILLGIGEAGLRRTDQIKTSLDDALGRRWAKLQLSEEAVAISNRNSRVTLEAFLLKDGPAIDKLLTMRAENSAEIASLVTEIEARCESEQEKQLLGTVKQRRTRYVETYLRALRLLVQDKNREAAATVMVEEALPALRDYHQAWDDFVEFQKQQLDWATQQARSRYVSARRTAWLLIALAAAIALAIAAFVTRKTAGEMSARMLAQQNVTELNAELEHRVTQRTQELTDANAQLAGEVEERKLAEQHYREEAEARVVVQGELVKSEERVNFALEAAEIGFWDWDISTGEQVWSGTTRALLGLSADSPPNFQSLMNAMHPESREKMWAAINQAIEDKKDYVFEYRVVWPDGSVHTQVTKGRAFYDDTGRPTRMAGIVINIDRRKAAEDRLRLQATALEAAANSIVVTDRKGTILWTNPAFTQMTGYTCEEAVGANPRILASGKHDRAFYSDLWRTISSGKVWRGEIFNRRKDGSLYNEEMTIAPVTSDRGEITHYVAIKQEVTGRKRMEEHFRQAQKLEAIGQLAAGIAHEINTPAQYVRDNTTFLKESWTSIAQCVSILRQLEAETATADGDGLKQFAAFCQTADLEYLETEIPQAIDQSLDGIERITKIVRAMKEFSHPGSQEKAPVDINRAIETTITVAHNEWRYVADMETHFDQQLPLVPCHASEIKQVILNLLTNAAYAIRQAVGDGGGTKGKIIVTTAHAGEFAEISVADTGGGIPEDIQSRIFEHFFTTKPVGSGTGQGLAMAHNTIVKRHGGKIWFETAAGEGATFFIRLPLTTAAASEKAVATTV